jgi:hypothetical protein
MSEENKTEESAEAEGEMTPYGQMISDRLKLLKERFDEFPLEEGEDESSKLPSFIMLHIAHLYSRIDLLLSEIDALKRGDDIPEEVASDPEYEKAKEDAEKDIEKELANV